MNLKITNVAPIGDDRSQDDLYTIYVKDGLFSDPFDGPFDREIDAQGLSVLPGLIDAHVHLRDPGFEYKEDILSGTKAAAAGGVTSVACMPNTNPVIDNATVVRYIMDKAEEKAVVNVFPIGAVSKGLKGEELAEIGLMKEAGIVAVTDDGNPVSTAELMKKAMRYANDFDLVVIDHCEEPSMKNGVMNEGVVSMELGVVGIPDIAEDMQVARDIFLAEYLDLPVHIAHVSTKGAVDLIREAKKRGVKVTGETCPQYFTLTEEDCRGYNTLARCNPPLRTEEDRIAIIEGMRDGTLDLLVSDHAPHHNDDKDIEFSLAANGMTGLETLFGLAYTKLVKPGLVPFTRLVEALTKAPSDLLKLGRGEIKTGLPADLSIFDLDSTFTVDRMNQVSKSKNTPFHGYELHGVTVMTIVGGRIAFEKE
ncbi:MAG TPA: dihydroorotase [Fastidiosipila sp.]|nr:dihydroorotase [Fastidiosipila sp.]